jgi:hypothetical protein
MSDVNVSTRDGGSEFGLSLDGSGEGEVEVETAGAVELVKGNWRLT